MHNNKMRRRSRMKVLKILQSFSQGTIVVFIILFFSSFINAEPGYLDFDNLPETNFTCAGKVIGGYYADLETSCQMFHVCTIGQLEEPMDIKFLCLNGTVFDQETRVCERVDEVDCTKSERFYYLNLELYGNTIIPSQDDEESNEQSMMSMKTSKPTTAASTTSTTQRPFMSKTTASPYKNSYLNTSTAPPRGATFTSSTTATGLVKFSSTSAPTLTDSIEIDDSDNDEDIEYYDDDYGIDDEHNKNSKENNSQKPLMPHQFTIAQNSNNNAGKGDINIKITGQQNNDMATISFQQQQQMYTNHGTSITNTQSHGTMLESFYPNNFQKHNFNVNSNNNDNKNKPLPFSTQRPIQTNLYTSLSPPAPRFPLLSHPKGQSISSSGFSELSLQAHQQKAQGFKLTNQQQQKQQQQQQMQQILMHQEQEKKQQQKQQQQLLQQQYQQKQQQQKQQQQQQHQQQHQQHQQQHQQQQRLQQQQQYKQQSHRRPENILLEERFEGYRRQSVPQITLKLPFENQRIQKEITLPLIPSEEDFSPHNSEHKELKRSDPHFLAHKQTSTVPSTSQQPLVIHKSSVADDDNFRIDLNENSSKKVNYTLEYVDDININSSHISNSHNSNLNSRNSNNSNSFYDKVLLEPQELYRKSLPKVVISLSASASVSDSNGKKLNLSVANVLASNPKIPPLTYDEYKEDDVILDPFFLDVPKIKPRIKRNALN